MFIVLSFTAKSHTRVHSGDQSDKYCFPVVDVLLLNVVAVVG